MLVLGIDIGGTKCACVLADTANADYPDKLIIDKLTFPTDVSRGWRVITEELLDCAERLCCINGLGKGDIESIGISCGGPLDSRKGIICRPPNLPDWDDVPICDMFKQRFGAKVILQNDANACAVAEWRFGAGKGYNSLIFLTFGTGMGAGLILDGRLYSGACDLAGEVGHIRLSPTGPVGYGKVGSFEGFCSGGGIARLAEEMIAQASEHGEQSALLLNESPTAKDVALAAFRGDPLAQRIYDVCANRLGQGLAMLIDLLNPQAIIIGSIFERSRALFDRTITEVIRQEALPLSAAACKILPSALSDSIGDFAAIGLTIEV